MTYTGPKMLGLYLFISDIGQPIKFYADLGLEVEAVSEMFARVSWQGETMLELGTEQLTTSYDPGWEEPGTRSKGTINFELESRQAVDLKFAQLVELGYTGHLAPCDPLWQARFAIVLDPDGNQIGLHSPRSVTGDRVRESGGSTTE